MNEVTDNDMLTWEMQLRREGTLPPEVQRKLLALVAELYAHIEALDGELAKAEEKADAELAHLDMRVYELENRVAELTDDNAELYAHIEELESQLKDQDS
jgi:peptidoglycan hydrolase CwlO-like protein